MDLLSKIVLVVAVCMFILTGCASRQALVKNQPITLPKRPDPVIMYGPKSEHKVKDPERFPDAKWIKEPKLDPAKQRGYWSYKDIGTISEGLAEWEFFYKDTKEIVEGHNNLTEGKGQYTPPSWWPW